MKTNATLSSSVAGSVRTAKAYLEANPDAGRIGEQTSAVLEQGLLCRLAGPEGWEVTTDMHPLLGGGGTAPPPSWFMRAALASCTATVIAMHAAQVGIELDQLRVDVDSDSDVRGLLGIDGASVGPLEVRMCILISGDAPSEVLHELVAWSTVHSPVGAVLGHQPTVTVDVLGKATP